MQKLSIDLVKGFILNKPKALLLGLGGVSLGSIILYSAMMQSMPAQEIIVAAQQTTNQDNVIARQLNEIQEKLALIQGNINQEKPQPVNLDEINGELGSLKQTVATLSQETALTLKEAMQDSNTSLERKLDSISNEVATLNTSQHKPIYLAPKDLPFAVLSIDSIQEQSVVSLEFHYKTVPIEKGDSLAGWVLINADYGKQVAEFVNPQKQHVQVKLKAVA